MKNQGHNIPQRLPILARTSPRWMALIGTVTWLGSMLAMSGCLSKPALHEQTFAFNEPASALTNGAAASRVLGIKSVQIAPPFDGRPLVYRTGAFSYERDPYASFLSAPADALALPAAALLRRDGDFKEVVQRGDVNTAKPDTLVDINVSELYGDIREPGKPRAVLALQVIFLDATNGLPGNIILLQNYSKEIPIKTTAPGDLMQGWNEALAGIFAEAALDFRHQETAREARDDSN